MSSSPAPDSPRAALEALALGNERYQAARKHPVKPWPSPRAPSKPYAALFLCSDLHVRPEHLFSAQAGDLFVVSAAGDAPGALETGSLAYAAGHLGVKLVLVMGICPMGTSANSAAQACAHMALSHRRILENRTLQALVRTKKLAVISAEYDGRTGKVRFLTV